MPILECQSPSVWLPTWLSFLAGIPEIRRRKKLLVILQAYVDETGTDGRSPVILFTALISSAENWAKFAEDWDACLKSSPSIQYFKMDDAAGRNGEFYGFSVRERDKKLKALCQVLNQAEATEISVGMEIKGFSETWKKTAGKPLREPYFFPFHMINIAIAYQVKELGADQPIEIFFHRNDMFGPKARMWYPVICAGLSPAHKALMPVEPIFRSDHEVLPLQASDLIAWIMRHGYCKDISEFSWLGRELDRLNQSPLSGIIDGKWIKRLKSIDPCDPQYRARDEAALVAFKETFGFDWPPKNKRQLRKMQGRR